MAHSLHSQQPPESKHGEHNAPRKHTSVNALIGFVLVVIAAIFVMSVLFRVHDIRVEGNEHYTDEEIIKAIDIEDGDNLFFYVSPLSAVRSQNCRTLRRFPSREASPTG